MYWQYEITNWYKLGVLDGFTSNIYIYGQEMLQSVTFALKQSGFFLQILC